MPIETICQGCARKLRVPDEHAGKKARCPKCGTIYVVPGSAAGSPVNTKDDEPAAMPSPNEDGERWQLRTSDGRVYGPVPESEIDQWYAEGRISREALLLRDGDSRWQSAADVFPQRMGGRTKISEQENPFSDVAATSPFQAARPLYQSPHRGGLILTFAILGWALCPVFAPFAWAMGKSDLRSMQLGHMDPRGSSLTQAGMVLGLIQTILVGIICVLACFGMFA